MLDFYFLKCNLPALFAWKVERLRENKESITQKLRYLQFSDQKSSRLKGRLAPWLNWHLFVRMIFF